MLPLSQAVTATAIEASFYNNNNTATVEAVTATENNIASINNVLQADATLAGNKTLTGNITVQGTTTVNGGFIAIQNSSPFSFEKIPKPVQTPSNLFEIKINGSIQATLFSPTAVAVPYFKQFTGSNLTIANNGTVGIANSIDATRVSGQLYYLWLIGKDDGTLAGLFSASNIAPTMPTGYTWRRLLPWACATYPPNGTYQNGVDISTDITGSGREGAFIEHLVSNWGCNGGNNPVITYVSRFRNGLNNASANAPTLISSAKSYNTTPTIENLACLNVSLSGQPMWLVPPEIEAVGLHCKFGGASSQLNLGSQNSAGYYIEQISINTTSTDTCQTPLFPVTSRTISVANNVSGGGLGVREFRCNFTNFWI